MKRLIINADDFGFTRDVNAGILHAHREGVLTSTTLMANGDAYDDALRLALMTPSLDIGCHLVLVQGRSLVTGEQLPAGPRQLLWALARGAIDIYAELRAQIEKVTAAGLRPTHLDSHKHTHLVPRVFRVVAKLAHEFKIPYIRLPLDSTFSFANVPCAWANRYYRGLAKSLNVRMPDHFLGFKLTGYLTEQSFARSLERLPEGTTEFMCHPGFCGPELQAAQTRLKESRRRELDALVAPAIRQLINDRQIHLSSFGQQP